MVVIDHSVCDEPARRDKNARFISDYTNIAIGRTARCERVRFDCASRRDNYARRVSARTLIVISILTCLVLAMAQAATAVHFLLFPPPYAPDAQPQGTLDMALGLLAGLGGALGFVLAVASWVFGMILTSASQAVVWLIAIATSGVAAVIFLFIAAFLLLGLPANPFHPVIIFIVIPLTTLAYGVVAGGSRVRGGWVRR